MRAGSQTVLRGIKHMLIAVTIVAAMPVLAEGDIKRVEAVGQAVATGAASDARLRSRALQDALYQAALKGGASVNGYSVTSNAVLTSDVLVVRPDSQILDYRIVEEKVTRSSARIAIQAYIGRIDAPPACARRAVLDIALQRPQVKLAASAPAWLIATEEVTAALLERDINALDGVTLVQASDASRQSQSSLAAEFDYTSLTLGVLQTPGAGAQAKTLTTMISLSGSKSSAFKNGLMVQVESKLFDPSLESAPLMRMETRELLLNRTTPIQLVNANSRATRQEILMQIGAMARDMARDMIIQRMCQSLSAKLVLREGTLTAPFGRNDGLTRHHLAYTQGGDTPYEILEIEVLNDQSAEVRPLDSSRTSAFFAGQTVQFMELK
ncbi:MAG: flagellar assembly protein T N-terminal domain-containing protein [Planktomarina sp.]|nr:flagellar assembly protein T N-terminal domain-containing protein [Planktomarina sp.]